MENVSAKSRYTALESFKSPSLHRAREAARLTIPSLFPPEGNTDASKLPTPWQSLGARGVNNLSAKFLLTLLPPNTPFFKLMIDEYTLEELTQQEGMRAEVEEALGKIERAVMNEVEALSARPVLSEVFKQLLVAGNVLLFVNKGVIKMYRLDKYVVSRDPSGNLLELVIKETVSPKALPEGMQLPTETTPDGVSDQKNVDIYTYVGRDGDKFKVFQEVNGVVVPNSQGEYPLDSVPWMPLRFNRVDGEDYGRGYVEEYIGDLKSAEGLQKAIVEGAAAAAKILIFVDPNGVTQLKVVAEAPNGAVRSGRAQDVTVMQSQKSADFGFALQTLQDIIQRLAYAFLMNSAIQRNGERVTAEEIRYMANELEDALGGTYSIMGQELQRPLVNVLMRDLQKRKKIPALPKGTVSPTITTGLDALGRGHDLSKLDAMVGGAQQVLGPDVVKEWIHVSDYLTRRGTALGIDAKGLVKTKEEKAEEDSAAMEQQQQLMMAQQAMQTGGKVVENVTKEGMTNGNPQ